VVQLTQPEPGVGGSVGLVFGSADVVGDGGEALDFTGADELDPVAAGVVVEDGEAVALAVAGVGTGTGSGSSSAATQE